MEWICSGVAIDWEAWSVLIAVIVFVWNERSKRTDRRAAGRLMARLLIPELKQLKKQLEAVQAQFDGAWPPGGPPSGVRDLAIADLARVAAPSLDRGLDDLASLPARVTDKVTSMLGWFSQLKNAKYMDPEVPYGLDDWQFHFETAYKLLELTIDTCEVAIERAREIGAPPSLIDRYWRWPRQKRRDPHEAVPLSHRFDASE